MGEATGKLTARMRSGNHGAFSVPPLKGHAQSRVAKLEAKTPVNERHIYSNG